MASDLQGRIDSDKTRRFYEPASIKILSIVTGVGLFYGIVVVPWMTTWGATEEEVERPMLGDSVFQTSKVSTRAIDIDAPPEAVWPWLVQIGQGRGGMYSYEWIEDLFGAGIVNTDSILPEHQHLQAGDSIQFSQGAMPPPIPVRVVDWEHAILLGDSIGGTWLLAIERNPDNTTRLYSRWRAKGFGFLWDALLDPGSFVMERRMLLGIKERAERIYSLENK